VDGGKGKGGQGSLYDGLHFLFTPDDRSPLPQSTCGDAKFMPETRQVPEGLSLRGLKPSFIVYDANHLNFQGGNSFLRQFKLVNPNCLALMVGSGSADQRRLWSKGGTGTSPEHKFHCGKIDIYGS
jgi:hypothetical protein